jgi:peptidoglycan/xylan/chitin deacetylase (PgdA/CDA1 family)
MLGVLMFVKTSLGWVKPENRTLVLTYDDGPGQIEAEPEVPGPRTLDLAKYLHEMNIPATFFVIGKHAAAYGKVLEELARLGHLVGNHTYSHPSGDPRDASGWPGDQVDQISEIKRTHEIIKPYVQP